MRGRVQGMLAEVRALRIERFAGAVPTAQDPARLDEVVVLQEAHEHRGEHPRDRHLREVIVAPRGEVRAGAAAAQGAAMLLVPRLGELRGARENITEVVLDLQHQAAGIGGECLRVDHGATSMSGREGDGSRWTKVSLHSRSTSRN